MFNYSIVIPHKNSPELLQRCLKSIPYRPDIQVLVVDDSSDDVELLKKSVSPFSHVELILTNEKKGAGYARNIGLSKVSGRWIIFADADDFFHEGFLEKMDLYKDSDYDIVFFDTDSYFSDSLLPAKQRIPNISRGVARNDQDLLKWRVTVVWGKMYASQMILQNRIFFDEVLSSNDVMFAYFCSNAAKKCIIDPFVLYASTINTNSLCFSMNQNNLEVRMNVRIRANRYLRNIGKRQFQVSMFNLVLSSKEFGIKFWWYCFIKYLENLSCYSFFAIEIPTIIRGVLKTISGKANLASKSQSFKKESFYK